MWRNIASNAITFLILGLFLLGGLVLWGMGQYTSDGPLDQAICLQVERGSNMRRVSKILEDQGAVSSGAIFRVGADYSEKSAQLKAGSYLIEPASSMVQIVDVVTRGGASTCGTEIVYRIGVNRFNIQLRELDPATNRYEERANFAPSDGETPPIYTSLKDKADTRLRIALAEGVTSWQVAESLKAMDVLSGEIADIPAEGTLAPDSYEVRPGTDRNEVLTLMQLSQNALVQQAWDGRADGLPVQSAQELLILASIIEKETGVADERGQVAGVFVNRLNRGMQLQTDPTVIYGITQGVGVLGRGLRRSELRRETPWNTYVIKGLPPTPIANPGRASLMAAANPDETGYIFFVADGTGGHAFAETLAEHNKNVAAWRKIERERMPD